MSFVYPNFLWAYLLIAIPIIVHLFNFRRYKTIYFSRVEFLKEVTEDSKSGLKLKHLLVLISRILAIICLVTAFAQPYIPLEDAANIENITSVYIDNSYSMEAEGKDGNLLNEAKNQAIDVVRSMDENERINLITSDLLSKHQRFYSKSEVIDMIKEIEFSAKSTSLTNVLSLQLDLFNGAADKANKRIFLFSDFQKSSNDLTDFKREGVSTFYYQAEAQNKGNVYIDSVWFQTPVHRVNTPIDIFFRIYNETDEEQIDLPVNLSIDGSNPGPKRINVPANSFVDEKITFTEKGTGIKNGKLTITTNQLFFDDEFYFSYEIKEEVKILLITDATEKNINIEQLYGLDDYYNCQTTSINTVSQEDFKGKELIIFQNVNNIPSGLMDIINDGLKSGITVMFIPGKNINMNNWDGFMSQYNLPTFLPLDSSSASLSYFNDDDPLYTGVFEGKPSNFKHPKLKANYDLFISNANNFITLFGTGPTNPFLYYSKQLNGKIIVMTAPLDLAYSDFQIHALFAATMLRFAETASFQKPLYMEIGNMGNFPLNTEIDEKAQVRLINKEFEVDVIPLVVNTESSRAISFSHMEDQLKQAGIYDLTNEKDFKEKIAINYSRNESVTECFENEEIKESFESVGWQNAQPLAVNDSGTVEINQIDAKEYWRILLILGLIFLAIEILILRLWNVIKFSK
ncbi:BatA and WFA domain-containing protein [Paracrocinitomix mangrovi]|uniref:vWA domain-containing protein n=1 Tax=Paracrocinitomix mangrovi TaxID=2862509 RepID=UPI001C8E1DDD|nr:BatA and WFA domain-containing protein [Paracrocinitomix mangrovi]UKN02372.1 BatA and WFA domain-containing protein [Paracrocinitomix mangrovi]